MDLNNFQLIGFALVAIYGLLYLIRLSLDSNSTFEEPIKKELEAHNYIFVDSIDPSEEYTDQIKKIKVDGIHANPIGAGSAAAVNPHDFVFKEVSFKDESGELYNALAVIDFRGLLFRRIASLRWYPQLASFE